jgi:hypothetical protein
MNTSLRKLHEAMSEVQNHPSPDERFVFVVGMVEMRMSHWVNSAALWQREPRQLLLELGDSLWSTDTIVWSEDGRRATVCMRRYPGDGLPIMLDLLMDEAIAVPHAPADTTPIPFASLNDFLDRHHQQSRRR